MRERNRAQANEGSHFLKTYGEPKMLKLAMGCFSVAQLTFFVIRDNTDRAQVYWTLLKNIEKQSFESTEVFPTTTDRR